MTGPGSAELTVAVTGPTGTFGFGLMPFLEADDRIGRVVGIARRPFDPRVHGWSKMTYSQGDVRDQGALRAAFAGADVVIHLAFLISGAASPRTVRETNVAGTLNAFRAATAVGARRFVHASSVAAYGFRPDTPEVITEDRPVAPDARLFYAREKAELELALSEQADAVRGPELYLLRPSIVVGPHTMGAKNLLPRPVADVAARLSELVRRLPVPVPALVPALRLQLVHESDVGQALLLCALGAGPPGAYNLAADGELTTVDLAREFGVRPIPALTGLVRAAARTVSLLPRPPFLPPVAQWVEVAAQPLIMDTGKARRELGWRPRHTALEALRDTPGLTGA